MSTRQAKVAPLHNADKPPLLDRRQTDRALRDLMPIVDWLTAAENALRDGANDLCLRYMGEALKALQAVPADSPAVKAYMRWVQQNTEAAP